MNRIAFVLSRMASASLLSACFLLGMSSCGKEDEGNRLLVIHEMK